MPTSSRASSGDLNMIHNLTGSSATQTFDWETYPRRFLCGWRGCATVLSSWSSLAKHVKKHHCAESAEVDTNLTITCGYGSCHTSVKAVRFSEHVRMDHLGPMKQKCPAERCKETFLSASAFFIHIQQKHKPPHHHASMDHRPFVPPCPPPLPTKNDSTTKLLPGIRPSAYPDRDRQQRIRNLARPATEEITWHTGDELDHHEGLHILRPDSRTPFPDSAKHLHKITKMERTSPTIRHVPISGTVLGGGREHLIIPDLLSHSVPPKAPISIGFSAFVKLAGEDPGSP
ncbi:hypothetical protein SISSUDRAFT_1044026 [Sistotremastrum suecicum HHB10207 ss-3]|uniref:C2H2-type domain-containing protein n=1 Tax=Sistotremastrum suecicum HHB10207 ss-3 TaxID=1314776 RepID=A0A166FD21_9AGAM|nr:hypothetical protein SISSUDRAFT_1044026 [Sistotremastrum suecicum HHB10207 ss-3]